MGLPAQQAAAPAPRAPHAFLPPLTAPLVLALTAYTSTIFPSSPAMPCPKLRYSSARARVRVCPRNAPPCVLHCFACSYYNASPVERYRSPCASLTPEPCIFDTDFPPLNRRNVCLPIPSMPALAARMHTYTPCAFLLRSLFQRLHKIAGETNEPHKRPMPSAAGRCSAELGRGKVCGRIASQSLPRCVIA